MNITDAFIGYIYEMAAAPLPERIETKAKQVLLDYLGVAYSGAYAAGGSLVAFLSNAQGKCTVLGCGAAKTDLRTAAFVNGFHAHMLELDDGHRFGMIHLGAVIVSAVLAVAQQEALPFEQMLKGIVAGYEAAVRTAVAIQPGHKKLGYHTTGTCGTIGAALGCAAAMKMDRKQMKSVLSAAAASAAGLLEIQENASQLKAYNAANAAMSGVTAALIGKSGLCGPDDILGGDRGFLAIHSKTVAPEKMVEKTDYYEIERIYVKPYAACRHCHSALEAVMSVRKKLGVQADEIRKIRVETYNLALRGHDHTQIQGVQSAKLSMPYSVAAAFILNTCGVDAYTAEKIANAEILDLAKKVEVQENSEFTELSPGKRIAKVTVFTKRGESASWQVDYAKGDPENPMTVEEITSKFMEQMAWCGRESTAKKLTGLFASDEITSEKLFDII